MRSWEGGVDLRVKSVRADKMMSSTYQAIAAVASPEAASDNPGKQRYTRSLHCLAEKVMTGGCSGEGLVREQQGRAADVAAVDLESGHSGAQRRRRSGDGTGPSG